MMVFGYARVSSHGQDLERQIQAIKEFRPDIDDGCIFKDKITGTTFDRPEYSKMKQFIAMLVKSGQPVELVIEEFDRLGRNKAQVKEELAWFKENGVIVRILNLPTTLTDLSDDSKFLLDMVQNILIEVLGTIAEAELQFRSKRQREGIEIAKDKGVYKGRKPIQIDILQISNIHDRWKRGELSSKEAMSILNLKPNTFYRRMRDLDEDLDLD